MKYYIDIEGKFVPIYRQSRFDYLTPKTNSLMPTISAIIFFVYIAMMYV